MTEHENRIREALEDSVLSCLVDATDLRALLADLDAMRGALEFYADGNHFVRADADAWETVSGEPPNFWEDEANTATVEDGTVARAALKGASA